MVCLMPGEQNMYIHISFLFFIISKHKSIISCVDHSINPSQLQLLKRNEETTNSMLQNMLMNFNKNIY